MQPGILMREALMAMLMGCMVDGEKKLAVHGSTFKMSHEENATYEKLFSDKSIPVCPFGQVVCILDDGHN